MKIRELLSKLLGRSAGEDAERSGDAVNEAFTVSEGESYSSWIPSQQDRPRH